jgi:hypothetical protein
MSSTEKIEFGPGSFVQVRLLPHPAEFRGVSLATAKTASQFLGKHSTVFFGGVSEKPSLNEKQPGAPRLKDRRISHLQSQSASF